MSKTYWRRQLLNSFVLSFSLKPAIVNILKQIQIIASLTFARYLHNRNVNTYTKSTAATLHEKQTIKLIKYYKYVRNVREGACFAL